MKKIYYLLFLSILIIPFNVKAITIPASDLNVDNAIYYIYENTEDKSIFENNNYTLFLNGYNEYNLIVGADCVYIRDVSLPSGMGKYYLCTKTSDYYKIISYNPNGSLRGISDLNGQYSANIKTFITNKFLTTPTDLNAYFNPVPDTSYIHTLSIDILGDDIPVEFDFVYMIFDFLILVLFILTLLSPFIIAFKLLGVI